MPGWNQRLEGRARMSDQAQYRERLDFELDVITSMGFAGYFLIVADFIKWAKANDIPVGPGRGSGAGCVVAWALTITDLDPIALNLLFERFLNPERVSMPDFDIDFCETHRDKVIPYVQGKYGRDRVAQIITFGRLKARAVLKDTGRVLQMSYGQVDRLAKLVPNHPTDPWTLERSLERRRRAGRRISVAMPDVQAAVRPGDEARGPAAARLDPCRRRGDRRPPAGPAGAALPRPALGHAGHPVRHEICRGGGAGEVRLPRPQDPVGAQGRPAPARPAGHRSRFRDAAVGRPSGLRAAPARRHGRRVPAGIGRHAAHACRGPADQLRRHHRPGLALPARPDGQHPAVRRPQERPRRDRLSAPDARRGAQGNLRHLRLPGAGDGGGPGAGRLLARRGRPAAPGDGQEDPVGDGRPARPLHRGRRGQRHRARPRPTSCST